MSSLALMRWLEGAPQRYDRGMQRLTLGRVDAMHDAVAEAAAPSEGKRILEIGCGTGAVTARLVARGAKVVALDQNPEMIERARERLAARGARAVKWLESTAAEIDRLDKAGFDAVVSTFCLSEMSPTGRAYVLRAAADRLGPGGLLVLADEVRPRRSWHRYVHAVARAPQAAAAWLITGSMSRPIADLPGEIAAAGFKLLRERRWLLGGFALLVAEVEQ